MYSRKDEGRDRGEMRKKIMGSVGQEICGDEL